MTPQTKKLCILGIGIVVILAIIGLVCYSIYDSTRSDLRAQISALPAFDESGARNRESQALGYTWPVLPPAKTATEITQAATDKAEKLVARSFTPAKLALQKKTAVANLKRAQKNQVVSFKLNDGKLISGKVVAVSASKITMPQNKSYTVGTAPENIAKEFAYLISDPALTRARLKAAAEVTRQFEADKAATMRSHLTRIEADMMQKDFYTCVNGTWIPATHRVESRVASLFAEYKRSRDAKIEQLLKANTCFGHQFTVEDLGITLK